MRKCCLGETEILNRTEDIVGYIEAKNEVKKYRSRVSFPGAAVLEMIKRQNGTCRTKRVNFRAYGNRKVQTLCTEATPPNVCVSLGRSYLRKKRWSFARWAGFPVRFLGYTVIGIDTDVEHSRLKGGLVRVRLWKPPTWLDFQNSVRIGSSSPGRM